MEENPLVELANRGRKGTQRIVSVQESHRSRASDDEENPPIGEAAANPGSSYKPKGG